MRGRSGATHRAMTRIALLSVPLLAAVATACGSMAQDASARATREKEVLAKRETRMAAALAETDSVGSPKPIARWLMPKPLEEISGIALTADERLLAHDDQHGRVLELDYKRGTIVKRFGLDPKVDGVDFEGITVADSSIFMIASNGTLYEFAEGADGTKVPYTKHDTQLGKECEFEGVAYDPAIGSLLLACKIVKMAALKDSLVIYRWKLGADLSRDARLSRLTVPLATIIGTREWKTVHPSDITVDARTGNYLMVASTLYRIP